MKGIKLRGVNHLIRLLGEGEKPLRILTYYGRGNIVDRYVFRGIKSEMIVAMSRNSPSNHNIGPNQTVTDYLKTKFDIVFTPEQESLILELYDIKGFRPLIVSTVDRAYTKHFYRDLFSLFNFVLDEKTETEFEEFKTTNKKVCDSVFDKYLPKTSLEALFIFMATDGNPTYFAWAAKNFAQGKLNHVSLLHLMDFATECDKSIKKLSKQNIVSISSSKDVLTAVWESFHIRAEIIANKTISMFNPMQKRLLKEKIGEHDVIQILNNFSKLSLTKKINFIRKVSTFDNADEIIRLMKYVCTNSYFNWNQDEFHAFLKNVEGLNYTLVYEKPNLSILQVHDYETIKRLGKMTNWCISKNKTYWDQYMRRDNEIIFNPTTIRESDKKDIDPYDLYCFGIVDDEKSESFKDLIVSEKGKDREKTLIGQYMVFDFNRKEDDRLSIVGITSNDQIGITHAHNFTNGNMMGGHLARPIMFEMERRENEESRWLKMFEKKINEQTKSADKADDDYIHGFLKNREIDSSVFTKYKYEKFEWNKENLLSFLNQYLDEESYDIVYEDDKQLLIRAQSLRVGAVMKKTSTLPSSTLQCHNELKYLFGYFDFANFKDSPNKMLFYGICGHDEEYAVGPYNEFGIQVNEGEVGYRNFTELILSLGLPFDIIRRVDSYEARINYFVDTENYEMVMKLLSENKVTKLPSKPVKYCITRMLSKITSDVSEFLKVYNDIKSLPLPMSKFFSKRQAVNFVYQVCRLLVKGLEKNNYPTYNIIEDQAEAFDFLQKKREMVMLTGKKPSNDEALFIDGTMYLHILLDFLKEYTKNGDPHNMYSVLINKLIVTTIDPFYINSGSEQAKQIKENLMSKTLLTDLMEYVGDRYTAPNTNELINFIKATSFIPAIKKWVYRAINAYFDTKPKTSGVLEVILQSLKRTDLDPNIPQTVMTIAKERGYEFNGKGAEIIKNAELNTKDSISS